MRIEQKYSGQSVHGGAGKPALCAAGVQEDDEYGAAALLSCLEACWSVCDER